MDQEIRAEFEKLHGRINSVSERVTVLETNLPHITAALVRIEGNVKEMISKIDRWKWAFLAPAIALVLGGLFKLMTSGALEKL